MEELRQEFLNEAISNLDNLQKELQAQEFFPDPFLQEIFRRIHTIKGTSQTFGFNIAGNIAHEIENVLQVLREKKITQNKEVYSIINEGIQLLHKTLKGEQSQELSVNPTYFVEKVRNLIPYSKPVEFSEIFPEDIPKNLLSQLSVNEINLLTSAIQNGNALFLIDVGFNFPDFDTKLKELREILTEYGEILATLPSQNVDSTKQIGFQLYYVSKIKTSEITKIILPFEAALTFESKPAFSTFDLQNVLSQIVVSGEKTAQALGKDIEFQILSEEITASSQNLKIIYEILLHLTRNAIDHAIESPQKRFFDGKNSLGEIQIAVLNRRNNILLRVKDDGCGIDYKEVIKKAEQKGLVFGERVLTEKEALELIFLHGFSTSETISEISGRGVGLDIVREVVDNIKGKIKIQTTLGQGTTFEVYLPQNN